MDFLDPKKQRRHGIQLMVGYVLVACAILLSTLILIYYAYGFGVSKNGDLTQKGLVFVSSQPSGAQLYVSGKRVNNTNTKLNLTAGDYALDISKSGYSPWHRAIEVQGGSVNHFVYPFLFPKKLETTAVKTYDTQPVLTTQSPDRRWLLAMTDSTTATFELFDLNKNQNDIKQPDTFTIPATLLTPSTTPVSWEVMEWSSNNRHVLLKRTFVTKGTNVSEYILIDRQRPDGSHNLTRELNLPQTATVTLRNKQPDRYYIYDSVSQVLSTASLDSPTQETVLGDVLAYKSHGDNRLLYTTGKAAPEGKVGVYFRQNDKDYFLRYLKASDTYLLDVAQYSGDWYMVVASHAESHAFIYRNPTAADTSRQGNGAIFALHVDQPTSVSFSTNAQFITAQNGTFLHAYDAENKKSYRYELQPPFDSPQTKTTWMDGSHLTYVAGGKQVVMDYDNTNKHALMNADPTYASAFDQRYRYVYSFTKPDTGQGVVLSATALRTPNDL